MPVTESLPTAVLVKETRKHLELIPIGFGFGTNETSIRQKLPKAIVSFLNPIGMTQLPFAQMLGMSY